MLKANEDMTLRFLMLPKKKLDCNMDLASSNLVVGLGSFDVESGAYGLGYLHHIKLGTHVLS